MEEIDKLKKKNADLFTENFDLKDQSNNTSSSAENEQGSPVDACSAFLIEEYKKGISEEIRQRNREKKLQHESAGQDSSFSELSHETEVIEGIANSAVDSNTISDRSALKEIGKTVSQGYDQSASENLEEIRKTVFLRYDRVALESLEEIESKADYQDKSVVGLSIVTEFVQGLLEELLSSDNQLLKDVKFSSPKTIIPRSIKQVKEDNHYWNYGGGHWGGKVPPNSDSDSDYDESIERIHNELTHKEVARLEALETIKSQPDIDFVLDDEKMDDKPEDINIFDDIDFDLDEKIMDDKPVNSNHPINARIEGVLTGIIWSNICEIS
ncbi:unnamed protein product [Rhizophagus irregularis]|nr:unnamed protein product [Rhizophagus irregularis]